MGQTAEFAAGSWIVRQAPETALQRRHLPDQASFIQGTLAARHTYQFDLFSAHPETPDGL
jgi:hypothetical protein